MFYLASACNRVWYQRLYSSFSLPGSMLLVSLPLASHSGLLSFLPYPNVSADQFKTVIVFRRLKRLHCMNFGDPPLWYSLALRYSLFRALRRYTLPKSIQRYRCLWPLTPKFDSRWLRMSLTSGSRTCRTLWHKLEIQVENHTNSGSPGWSTDGEHFGI